MASVSSTSGANQYGWQQLKLQQARRTADQAEQTAQSLRAQASDAQRVAEQAQDSARSLGVQSDQAQARAGQARQGLAAVAGAQQSVTQLANVADQVIGRQQSAAPATPNTAPAPVAKTSPVVNSRGQVTGKIINTSA